MVGVCHKIGKQKLEEKSVMKNTRLEKGLLTVIVPVYQVRQYLDRCIQSIVCQTYEQFQLILVDDGSTDGSGELCDRWAAKDCRIQVVHQDNGGLSAARNTGVRYAKGEALCFVDADDWIDSRYLEILYQNMKAADADVSCCAFMEVWEDTKMDSAASEEEKILLKKAQKIDLSVSDQKKKVLKQPIEQKLPCELLSGAELWRLLTEVGSDCSSTWLIVAWNKLIRTEIAGKLSFPEGKWHEDEFYIHRLLNRTCKVVKTEDILYYYRRRKDSISGADRQRDVRHLAILEAFTERLRYCRRQRNPELYQRMVNAYRQTIIIQYHGFQKTDQAGFLRSVYRKSLWDYPLYPVKKWRLFRSYLIFLISPKLFYRIYWHREV